MWSGIMCGVQGIEDARTHKTCGSVCATVESASCALVVVHLLVHVEVEVCLYTMDFVCSPTGRICARSCGLGGGSLYDL